MNLISGCFSLEKKCYCDDSPFTFTSPFLNIVAGTISMAALPPVASMDALLSVKTPN
jgi:hypothetical protein